MLSIPPASMTWRSPKRRDWAANIIVFIPEAQTLLIVVASVLSGQPAPKTT